jgi:hypothetical protein
MGNAVSREISEAIERPPVELEGLGSHILGFVYVTASYLYSEHTPHKEYLFRILTVLTFPLSVVTVSSRSLRKV